MEIDQILAESKKLFLAENFRRSERKIPSDDRCGFRYVKGYSALFDLRMGSSAKDICEGRCLCDCTESMFVQVRNFAEDVIGRDVTEALFDGITDSTNAEMLRVFGDKDRDVTLFLTVIIGNDACVLPLLSVSVQGDTEPGKWASYVRLKTWMMKAYAHGFVPCAVEENADGPVLVITDFCAEKEK